MNTLKPGYIPDGWRKGDAVHVVKPALGGKGAVVHTPRGIRRALMTDQPPGTVAMVKFRYEDQHEVAHWLAWWKGAH